MVILAKFSTSAMPRFDMRGGIDWAGPVRFRTRLVLKYQKDFGSVGSRNTFSGEAGDAKYLFFGVFYVIRGLIYLTIPL